ncbi:MAG: hypothetical protein WCB04_07545 [Mycobacteriales bacterium]
MSDTAGRHPGLDALSDLDAGLYDGQADEKILQQHVAGCAECADLVGLLTAARQSLADLPAVPMPADVAERIVAALAGEAAGAVPPASSGRDGNVRELRTSARRARARRFSAAGAVAAGVALLMATAVGIGALRNTGNGSETTSGAAREQSTAAGATPRAVDGVRSYTSRTLAGGVRALLAGRAPGAPGDTANSPPAPLGAQNNAAGPAALARLRAPAELASCVTELAGRPGVTPLAVDYAEYESKPAVVIVLPGPNASVVGVWVVGPACTSGNADLITYAGVPRNQ